MIATTPDARPAAGAARVPFASSGPAICGSDRMRQAATWAFLLPVFTEGVFPDVVKIQVAATALLAFTSLVILQEVFPLRAFWRIYSVFTFLLLTAAGYVAFGQRPALGTAAAYDARMALFIVTYTTFAVCAVMFFSLPEFEKALWRIATAVLAAGIISCLASRLTGHLFLVSPGDGALRMMGTLREPSEWAPILAAVLLLAARRRSWPWMGTSLAGLYLADSPTCVMVMIVSGSLYAVISSRWRGRTATIVLLAVLTALAVPVIRSADVSAWTSSGDPAVVAAGRLVSGIRNVETGGQQGQNTRFVSARQVIAAARDGGWITAGAGPGADAAYFPAVNAETAGTPVAPNAMWLSVLFDFGEWGLGIFIVMLLAGLWRMRRTSLALAIFLPFFTASMVNSAIPDYSVTALGILLLAFGWITPPVTRRRPPPASQPQQVR